MFAHFQWKRCYILKMENFRKLEEHNRKQPKLNNFTSFFYSMIEMIGNIIVYFVSLFTRKRTANDLRSMAK